VTELLMKPKEKDEVAQTAIIRQSGWKIRISKVSYISTLGMKIWLLQMLADHHQKYKQDHVVVIW